MNILHITESMQKRGGSEQYLHNLVSVQRDHGDNVAVLCDASTKLKRHEMFGTDYAISFSRQSVLIAKDILDICREHRSDLIHFHHSMSLLKFFLLFPLLARAIPVFCTSYCHDFYCPSGTKYGSRTDWTCDISFGLKCLPHMVIDRCQSLRPHQVLGSYPLPYIARKNAVFLRRLVVPSKYQESRLIKNGFEGNKIIVLPLFMTEPVLKDIHPKDGERQKILFSGRIVRYKGLEHLLRAVQLLKTDFELIVNGDGEDLKRVKGLASQWGLEKKITFQGWVSGKELAQSFRDCALVVVPSLWPEPQGIVGIEAMSYAKPVVAYNVGGISEWLDDGKTGYLVQPLNVRQLAAKIEILLKDRYLAKQMGENGRQFVLEKFQKDEHYRVLKDIYQAGLHESH